MFAGRLRVGWAPASRRESRCQELAPRPVRQNYRAADDDRPRHAFQIGGRDDCGDRKQRPVARRSTQNYSCFPCDDPKKKRGGTGRLDRTSESESRCVLSQRCHEIQGAGRAAIISAWSNGQTEGQITKLKLVKRQMYGRGNSICSKRASSAPIERELHQNFVRANFATPNNRDDRVGEVQLQNRWGARLSRTPK